MALATGIPPGTSPAFPRQIGAQPRPMIRPQGEPRDALAELLGDVKGWARHQRMADLVQAMDEAQQMLAAGRQRSGEVRHG